MMQTSKNALERLFDYLYHKQPQRIPDILTNARAEYRKLCEDLSNTERLRLSFIRSLLDYCSQERWGMALNQLEPAEEEYHRHFVSRMRQSSKQGYYQLHGKEVYKTPPESAPNKARTGSLEKKGSRRSSRQQVSFGPQDGDSLAEPMANVSLTQPASSDTIPGDQRGTSGTTQVTESFRQLKEREWTAAVKELELLKIDEKCVATCLLRILMDAYRLCKLEAENQIDKMEKAIHEIMMEGVHDTGNVVKGRRSCLVQYRKDIAGGCVERLQESFQRRFLPEIIRTVGIYQNIRTHGPVHEYTNQCVLTCWNMVTQDPPVHVQDDRNKMTLFNHELYVPHTCDGQSVNYYVWPVLKASTNGMSGALLAKGVAQGR